MNRKYTRLVAVVLGGVSLIAVGGCRGQEGNPLVEFIAEFARNALAAYLL